MRWMPVRANGFRAGGNITRKRFNLPIRSLGPDAFSRMLLLLDACWHGDPDSLNASMISGMPLFLKTYGHDLNDTSFSRRMAAIAP